MSTPFKTWINYKEEGPSGEINDLPSMTQPDMALSLREMLDRYARGLPVTLREGTFEEEDYSDFDNLDMSDIDDLKMANAEYIKDTTEKLKAPKPPKPPVDPDPVDPPTTP